MELTFKLIIEHKIKTLEEETMLGLYDIIDRMHKHAVKDYINVISCYFDEDLDKPKSEVEFNKIFQGVTLALARSPRRVSKVSGERKSSITRPFGEYDFNCQEII